jgi:hypothetical protein
MPPVSQQQRKLMHGLAEGSIKPRKGLPPKSVAKEFASADKGGKLPKRAESKETRTGGKKS